MRHVIIGGSGFFGATCARILAESGYNVTIIEKENHIGGLAYDYIDSKTGICVHKYGPHVLNVRNRSTYEFLSKYGELEECEIIRRVMVGNDLLPLPINLVGIQNLANIENLNDIVHRLEKFDKEEVKLGELLGSKDNDIQRLGKIIYEKVYLGYNIKMWGKRPEEVDPQTINRLPIRLNNNVFIDSESMHLLPRDGYVSLFQKMLSHENIAIQCKTDFVKIWTELQKGGKGRDTIGVFSGPIDELFKYKYGALQYRSMVFKKTYRDRFISKDSCVITYPTKYLKTRTTDMGMLMGKKTGETVWVSEYPEKYDYKKKGGGKPAYPVNELTDKMTLKKYIEEVNRQNNLFIGGRLAEYKYYNIEDTIQSAIKCAEEIMVNDK